MRQKAIHKKDALELLADGQAHKLRLWKLGRSCADGGGDILTYKDAVNINRHVRGGTHTVKLAASGAIRTFRDICLFEIDDLHIYL